MSSQSHMNSGSRVVRGPDWNKRNQDGGNGSVGTVVYVPKHGSSDDKVTVVWDSGRELRYRAGTDGKYDICLYDSAPAGIVHENITCDECKEEPIKGMRWKCTQCDDYDLCSMCYFGGKHDASHAFVRMDVKGSTAVRVTARNKCKARDVKGIFKGAKVMRGPHWKWKDQDGGEGEIGTVVRICDYSKESVRGGGEVKWPRSRDVGKYRLGGEGCVDLIYTDEATGGRYYPEHLPVVDVVNPGVVTLKCSDKVRVALDMSSLEKLQDNPVYGGWNKGMKQSIEEMGTVIEILFGGLTCKVQYQDGQVWTLNRNALTRIHSFFVGEAIEVLDNVNEVMALQEGHGGWNDNMQYTLGRSGRIIRIDDDGDLRVKVGDRSWIFSPVCIMSLESMVEVDKVPALTSSDEENESDDDDDDESFDVDQISEALAQLFADLLRGVPGVAAGVVTIVQAAAKGDLDTVKDIVQKSPDKVNQQVEGKTALQLACYQGQTAMVDFLLANKADLHLKDKEGDTALHYSAFGKEVDTMRLLLDRKANIDVQNNKGQTTLHIAVGKASVECCKLLIEKGCSCIIKDSDGDTPMHDSILVKDNQPDIVQTVLGGRKADFTVKNTKSFNVLHWAALKDCREAVTIILGKNKGIVNATMDQDYTALHIAAANDHVEIASDLISKDAKISPRDQNGRTPLHIAVSQGHKRTVELLVTAGGDVNDQDIQGNTALHIAQMHNAIPDDLARLLGVRKQGDVTIQITCFLVEARADLSIKNKKGETPLDLAKDDMTREFLKLLSGKAEKNTLAKTKKGIPLPSHWDSMDKEMVKRIELSPTAGIQQQEYRKVEQHFKKTLPQSQILRIQRIQNSSLWEFYALQKRHLEIEHGFGCANEQDLFHGTTSQVVPVICRDNFDFRLAGDRVGTLFGRGTYFATESKYSDGYAAPDAQKQKYMFIAKVLAGKTSQGNPDYKKPPKINAKDDMSPSYDCCVDNPHSPRIYCVFNTNQYYPEYLVVYR